MTKPSVNRHIQRQALGDLLPQGNPLNALTSALSPVASLSIPIGLPTVAAPPSTSLSSASKTTSSTSTSTGTTSARPTSTSTPSQSSSSQLDSLSPSSLTASSTALLPIASPGGTDRTTTVIHSATTSGSTAPSTSGSPGPPPKTFLQNKALSGFVFGLAGVVGLILIFIITTLAIRRRRRSKLIDDAISFDPPFIPNDRDTDPGTAEKGRTSPGDDGYGYRAGTRNMPFQHTRLSDDYSMGRQGDLKNLWETQSPSAYPLYSNKPRVPNIQHPGPAFDFTSTRTRY